MKKLLALVLALVMAMSLVTISNADFNDADKIDYAEAVDVMNAVGVLAGYDNGDFGPQDTLTRAQACKIIAYLDLGGKAADAIKGSGTVFSDVAANAWYAGYVEYCAGAGYVSGVGDGKFDPDAKVTGVQFAKMLLCALGYSAEVEGYNGSDWSLAIARDANKVDLFDALSIATSAALTREQAAQMALNALQATVVEYQGGTNVSTSDGTKVTVNATRNEVENGGGYDYGNGTLATQQLCEKLFGKDLKWTSDTDDFGAPASKWTYKGQEIGVYADEADATFTGKITYGDLYNAIGKTAIDNADGDEYVAKLDNKPYSAEDEVELSKITKGSKIDVPGTGNGVVTYVYVSDRNTEGGTVYDITIVLVNTYVGKVTSVTKATASADRKVAIANKGATLADFNTEYETESFAKDEYVLFNAAYTVVEDSATYKIVTAVAAESFNTAAVTAVKGTSNFVAGETYKYSKTYNRSVSATIALDNEYTVVLDKYGYVAFAELYNGANDYSKYLVITEDAMASGLGTTVIANAVVMDGTKLSDIKLNKLDGDKITTKHDGAYGVELDTLYSFTKTSDGKYDLKSVAAPYTDVALSLTYVVEGDVNYSFYKGATKVGTAGDDTYYANNDTTFVVYNSEDDEVTVYTGIKNMVNIKADDVVTIAAMYKTGTTAKLVYVEVTDTSAGTSSADDLVYLLSTTAVVTKDGDDEIYTYDAIVNGEVSTISLKNSGIEEPAMKLYFIDSYDGEYVDTIAAAGPATTNMPEDYKLATVTTSTVKVSGGVVTFSDSYVLADDCAVYSIDEDGNVTEIGVDGLENTTTEYAYSIVLYTKDNVTEAVAIYVQD